MVPSTKNTAPVIEAVGLTKVFKDFWGRPKAKAVNGISLSVKSGQIFGLLGPNGSGKSTTVKLILGLLRPTRGNLTVLDKSPDNVAIKKRIGYLPEESYLYRYLTARETLDFFGSLFGMGARERRNRIDQLLEMVGLAQSARRPVGEFSKGMARRIGLAQALINDPDLVILDEPTAGLDPVGCREMKDVIKLLSSRGKTVLLCSHLLADVEDVCDEVVVLYGGKIQTAGPLREMLSVKEQTRVLAPTLSDAEQVKLKQLFADELGRSEIRIDQPTMNLEEFFLDVVQAAREGSVETAGAQTGGDIAEYLRGDAGDLSGSALLEALGKETREETSGQREPPSQAELDEESAPAVDEGRLQELAGHTPEPPEEEGPPEPESPQQAEQKEQANLKIRELLKQDEEEDPGGV